MTISTTSIKAVATGNSATTVWPFNFPIPNQASLIVTLIDVVTGNPTVVAPVNYSVTGLGSPTGGSVTYPLSGPPLTNATQIVIQRAVADTQSTSFANQSATYPADIEAALDYLTMITQQIVDAQSRSIVFSIADTVPSQLPPATARAGKYLAFDAAGSPIASPGPVAGVAVSAAMTPVVQAATTAAALALLGIPGALLDQLIPAGTIWDYSLPTAPTGFAFPIGQACTSTYPVYRAALVAAGSPYGTNGVDPLMPDLRSVVSAGKSNMGGVDNGLLPGGTVLGALLGSATRVLISSNLPPYTPTGTNAAISVVSTSTGIPKNIVTGTGSTNIASGASNPVAESNPGVPIDSGTVTSTGAAPAFTGVAQGGTSTAFSLIQPTMVLNKIIKVH